MNPRMHPRGRPRATARDLRSHVLNDQIVILLVLTHSMPQRRLDLMRYELFVIEITLR